MSCRLAGCRLTNVWMTWSFSLPQSWSCLFPAVTSPGHPGVPPGHIWPVAPSSPQASPAPQTGPLSHLHRALPCPGRLPLPSGYQQRLHIPRALPCTPPALSLSLLPRPHAPAACLLPLLQADVRGLVVMQLPLGPDEGRRSEPVGSVKLLWLHAPAVPQPFPGCLASAALLRLRRSR